MAIADPPIEAANPLVAGMPQTPAAEPAPVAAAPELVEEDRSVFSRVRGWFRSLVE